MTAPDLRPVRGPSRETARETARNWLQAVMTQRLVLKVAAVLIALALWFRVNTEDMTEEQVTIRLALQTDSGTIVDAPTRTLTADVAGTPEELRKLRANPPVLTQTVAADAPDTVRVELDPDNVDVHGARVSVHDLQPRTLTVALRAATERRLPVRSALRLSAAATIRITGQPSFEPDSVLVSGAPERVRTLDAVWTTPLELVVESSRPILVALDTAALGVLVRPAAVRVRVPTAPTAAVPDTTSTARAGTARGGR
ncbi:MAG TPA: hypothetical protein VFK13_12880 [Gemmatimonadaceae bacterium]|nr:hypothetical protein [Gemmatimonadaceae bacterium]